jgi:DNA ligase (NAD+)
VYEVTADDLAQLDGFAEKSITNLLASIEGSKDRPIWRLLVGLSIRHVGAHVAEVLAEAFGSIDALAEATAEQIDDVPGIGPEIAQSIHDWFRDDGNRDLIDRLRAAGVRMADERTASPSGPGPLDGMSIVLTGGLSTMSRDEATALAKRSGARVSGTVSKKTDLVVAGESPGSKYDKAVSLGVEIVDEQEFLRRVGHS